MSAPLNPPAASPQLFSRLKGAKGLRAAVGEITEVHGGKAVWRLHPAYAAWFWPLMTKATELSLYIPTSLLEPAEGGDSVIPPRGPTEKEKNELLKKPERTEDAVQVYGLVLHGRGKQASIRKGFPTRTVALSALRYCRLHISRDDKKPAAAAASK
jgi:hypothetical protein